MKKYAPIFIMAGILVVLFLLGMTLTDGWKAARMYWSH